VGGDRFSMIGHPLEGAREWKAPHLPKRANVGTGSSVAAYVVPEDLWFLIPVKRGADDDAVTATARAGAASMDISWRWHLLGVKMQGLTIHACAERDVVMALIKAKIAQLFKLGERRTRR
jgi:hypothetical protein